MTGGVGSVRASVPVSSTAGGDTSIYIGEWWRRNSPLLPLPLPPGSQESV